MALSNQRDLPAFFSPRKVNVKIGLIPEDDLPVMVKSWKMTYRTENGQIRKMTYLVPRLAKSRLTTSWNLNRGFD
jgi:hypothetical protein